MSEENETQIVDTTNTMNQPDENIVAPADELSMLKDRARLMGIPFGGNIGVDALKKKINDRLNGVPSDEKPQEGPAQAVAGSSLAQPPVVKTRAQIEQELRDSQQAEHLALVRCRIYNLNPAKADLPGEIITVANRYVGTVRKFIPFGEATDNGYHIPRILFEDLKSRQFQHIQTKRNSKGQIEIKTRLVPEYNLVELPPLTQAELHELALRQAAAERVGVE